MRITQAMFEAALKQLERSGRVQVTRDDQGRKVYRLAR